MPINHDYITEYIRSSIPKPTGLLADLETYAAENHVPISQPETLRFIQVLCSITKPKRILEIGTAIAYFAINAASWSDDIQITTIEKSEEMANIARENIAAAKLENRIQLIHGDAKDILPELVGRDALGTPQKSITEQFDLIFLDAAKGQYMNFLPYCINLLKTDGILISDNVLFDGMVATDELWKKRKCTIIRNLREYIKEIMDNDRLETAIIPIGDGVAISYKAGE